MGGGGGGLKKLSINGWVRHNGGVNPFQITFGASEGT